MFVGSLIVYFIVQLSASKFSVTCTYPAEDPFSPPPPSMAELGVFDKAAIAARGPLSAGAGRSMLEAGGNAVDAVIATLLCDGLSEMQSLGVGGGFLMTLYNKSEGKTYSLIARETAPAAATQDMFVNDTSASEFGAIAAGVPAELKGYQAVHERFGKLPWKTLFQPAIEMCENGILVSKRLADVMLEKGHLIKKSPTFLSEVLGSTGGKFLQEGDILKRPVLAKTLRLIAESPNKAEELYNGQLTAQFVAEIQAGGGIITEQDMNNYNVRWEEPCSASVSGDYTVYSAALPGSGILVTFMLRLLDGLLQFANSDIERSLLMVEAYKHAFGHRMHLSDPQYLNQTLFNEVLKDLTDEERILSIRKKIKLGWTSNDPSYYGMPNEKEDHGTDNIVVVDQEGNAICATSSLNQYFGGKFVSQSTGIILNSIMDDFSTPGLFNNYGLAPSQVNNIEPGKRPMSSMSPTIVLDRFGDVKLVVGGAGGSTIMPQVVSVITKTLWRGMNVKEALDEPRYHHQLIPMSIAYEYGITKDMVSAWQEAGHSTARKPEDDPYCSFISAVGRLEGKITVNCDWRRAGTFAGI